MLPRAAWVKGHCRFVCWGILHSPVRVVLTRQVRRCQKTIFRFECRTNWEFFRPTFGDCTGYSCAATKQA
jgi:hypothetical protein